MLFYVVCWFLVHAVISCVGARLWLFVGFMLLYVVCGFLLVLRGSLAVGVCIVCCSPLLIVAIVCYMLLGAPSVLSFDGFVVCCVTVGCCSLFWC